MNIRTIAIIGLAMCSNVAWAACYNNVTQSTPTEDFTDHKNGTVTHNKTGLMWKTCSEGYEYKAGSCAEITDGTKKFTWGAALNHVNDLNQTTGFAGHKDWRLPNIRELVSIVEEACDHPAINATIFPNTSANEDFLSASPCVLYSNGVWYVEFGNGYHGWGVDKDSTNLVRLVRTP